MNDALGAVSDWVLIGVYLNFSCNPDNGHNNYHDSPLIPAITVGTDFDDVYSINDSRTRLISERHARG